MVGSQGRVHDVADVDLGGIGPAVFLDGEDEPDEADEVGGGRLGGVEDRVLVLAQGFVECRECFEGLFGDE
ncbi:MAG: hypothetical protein LC808_12510 [Actinobacteria bacterium]|nr:hypothetical protein [Actinomycetota bacterium]